MNSRILILTLLAVLAGFFSGIVTSEIIGIIGVLGFGRAVGIKYLPFYLAILFAILANLADARARRKSKRLDE